MLIPLYDDTTSRSIGGSPPGIAITEFTVSVFGPGLEKITREISAGTRYVNMYVPAGAERHFTLEVHFDITVLDSFTRPHLKSFIGRATADLRPGNYTKLKFTMNAGATKLIVPDRRRSRFSIASSIAWNDGSTVARYAPSDMDIAQDGSVYSSNKMSESGIQYGQDPSASSDFGTPGPISAIGIDRDRKTIYYSVNSSPSIMKTNILDSGTPYPGTTMYLNNSLGADIQSINGIAVDPWTGYIYMVGIIQDNYGNNVQALLKYNPFYWDGKQNGRTEAFVTETDFSQFEKLNDVIVKDSGIFILNEISIDFPDAPMILKFDRELKLIKLYGQRSRSGGIFKASSEPGQFYTPQRFFAHENQGLYITDDSANLDASFKEDFDKIIYINEDLDSYSWQTFPSVQPDGSGMSGEPFYFEYSPLL